MIKTREDPEYSGYKDGVKEAVLAALKIIKELQDATNDPAVTLALGEVVDQLWLHEFRDE